MSSLHLQPPLQLMRTASYRCSGSEPGSVHESSLPFIFHIQFINQSCQFYPKSATTSHCLHYQHMVQTLISYLDDYNSKIHSFCYIVLRALANAQSCNHHYNQDTKQFHNPLRNPSVIKHSHTFKLWKALIYVLYPYMLCLPQNVI